MIYLFIYLSTQIQTEKVVVFALCGMTMPQATLAVQVNYNFLEIVKND